MENESLVADLLAWISDDARPYHEVMDAWRTSCPRLTIWEDAVENGLVRRKVSHNRTDMVVVTPKGVDFLKASGRRET